MGKELLRKHGDGKEQENQLSKTTMIRQFVFSTEELQKTNTIKCYRKFLNIKSDNTLNKNFF